MCHLQQVNVEPWDCQSCAACCYSGAQRYIRVTGDDYARLGEFAAEPAHFIGNRAFMRMEANHCASLGFDPASRKFACTIYDTRPEVCRDLQMSSPACQAERLEKVELVLVTLRLSADGRAPTPV